MAKIEVESASEVYVDLCREKPIRVLHVDDDAGFLAVAKQCLEEQSQLQVDSVLSAEEALKKLRRSEYDVVVSDYQMPGKNGLEFLKELRREGNDVPLILFTCKGKEEIVIEALNSGVYRYVGKEGNAEVTYGELKRSICDAVRGQRAEKLLREAGFRLRQITENMQDLLVLTDENLVIKYASSSYKSVLGYAPSELVGKQPYVFVHPDDLSTVIETVEGAFKDNSVGRFECRVRRADGSYVLLEGVGKLLVDESGKVTGAVLSSRDITERRRMEQVLRGSEEKYRKLFEEAMDAIFIADAETGVIIDCNRAAVKLTGWERSELIGMHQRFLHPQAKVRGKFSENFVRHRTDKDGVVVEDQIVTKSGEVRDVVIKGNLVEVNGRELLQGVFRDVTERKRVEEEIRFQARLLDAMGQAVIAADVNGVIIYWNHAAEQLFGWAAAEVLGRNITEVFQDFVHGDVEGVLGHLSGGEAWRGEAVLKRRDGMRLSVILATAPIVDAGGEVVGVLGVSTDITEQKWMLEVFDEAIAKVVELNEKLRVVESLTRHDLRNKLCALSGRVFLLKKRLGGDEYALSQLGEVELVSRQMLKIMEFEKFYVQVGSEELKRVEVERCLSEAVLLFSGLKGARLVNECGGLMVLADSLLRQLFYNLIDNTLKYGEKVSRIRVFFREEGDVLKLVYEDDGVGIPDDFRENLFIEGFGQGTGYGLYLIKRICEEYGWTIQETGKQGKGAQFTMTIPKEGKDGKKLYEIS